MEYMISILVFSAVSALSWFLLTVYVNYNEEIKREEANMSEYDLIRRKSLLGMIKPLLGSIVELNKKKKLTSGWLDRSNVKYGDFIVRAGSPGNINTEEFLALKQFAPVMVSLILFMVGIRAPVMYIALAGFSFFLPEMWLNDLIKKRQELVRKNLPEALDTLALVVGAGLDFGEAMDTYVKGSGKTPLAEEFSLARDQMRLGKSRADVLRSMSEKIGYNPLTNFTTVVIQSEKTGTSLVDVLNAQSEDLRGKRFQMAEEMGQKAPVKMLAPLLLLVMPNVFIILFAPMLLKIFYR